MRIGLIIGPEGGLYQTKVDRLCSTMTSTDGVVLVSPAEGARPWLSSDVDLSPSSSWRRMGFSAGETCTSISGGHKLHA